MATKTIHTLAYKLLVDNSKFDKGMIASRGDCSAKFPAHRLADGVDFSSA